MYFFAMFFCSTALVPCCMFRNICIMSWVAQPEPGLELDQTSLDRPENSWTTTLPIQPDRAWQNLQRRMGETPQIQVCQACSVIPTKTQGCNRCQRWFNKVLSKGSEYLCKCHISGFYFIINSKNLFLLCHYVVLCIDWWGEKNNIIHFRIRL